jgi:hypothetical protein
METKKLDQPKQANPELRDRDDIPFLLEGKK